MSTRYTKDVLYIHTLTAVTLLLTVDPNRVGVIDVDLESGKRTGFRSDRITASTIESINRE